MTDKKEPAEMPVWFKPPRDEDERRAMAEEGFRTPPSFTLRATADGPVDPPKPVIPRRREIDEAQRIIDEEPTAPDAEARIMALRNQTPPVDRPFFALLLNALMLARDWDKPQPLDELPPNGNQDDDAHLNDAGDRDDDAHHEDAYHDAGDGRRRPPQRRR